MRLSFLFLFSEIKESALAATKKLLSRSPDLADSCCKKYIKSYTGSPSPVYLSEDEEDSTKKENISTNANRQ